MDRVFADHSFFTIPTLTFSVLYCFFVVDHNRRRILHHNVTKHPTSDWVVRQLREAFPYDSAPKYLIFDRSVSFCAEMVETIRTLDIGPKRTSLQSPWQNGVEFFARDSAGDFSSNCV